MASTPASDKIVSAADATAKVESAKRQAAYAAVDEYVRDHMVRAPGAPAGVTQGAENHSAPFSAFQGLLRSF